MNSVLINAVLSITPNYERVFECLRWPEDSWPQTERVEALAAFIQGLNPLLTEPGESQLTSAKKQSIIDQIESVIWTQCLPLLGKISAEAEGSCSRQSTAAVCRLVGVCAPLCDAGTAGRVALSVLPSLQPAAEDRPDRLHVEVASEVLAVLLPSLCADEQLASTILSSGLSCIERLPEASVSRSSVRLLLALLGCSGEPRLSSIRQLVLERLLSWHRSDRSAAVTARALLCLTALSDHLLTPSPSSSDPRMHPLFWVLVQDGLIHRDSVSRKRALYLLKRCVSLSEEQGVDCPLSSPQQGKIFCVVYPWWLVCFFSAAETVADLFKWAPGSSRLLREFWEDYALVMETLEENQVRNLARQNSQLLSLYKLQVQKELEPCFMKNSRTNNITDAMKR